MADEKTDTAQATERNRGLHRHGDPDPSNWEEQKAVTDRPNDTPLRDEEPMAVPNTTFAERAKARRTTAKQVTTDEAETEDKAVKSQRASKK